MDCDEVGMGEIAGCKKEFRHQGVRNIGEIRRPGTLRGGRLERGDTGIPAGDRRCPHHGEWLSPADWDVLDRRTNGTKPNRDMMATDGQKLTLGDTTVTLYITPGHTPGTISTLIPVKDNGAPHLAALWGGVGLNPDRESVRARARTRARGPH